MAVQVYILDFLEKTGVDEKAGKTYYACRICGRSWTREIDESIRKPFLTRMETEFNV